MKVPIPLRQAHEWVSFEDPDERRHWHLDVTFLLSNWTCIFGAGCQGVLTGPAAELAQGCCSYGAHLVDDDDAAHVEKVASTLTADDWQYLRKGRSKKGVLEHNEDGDLTTRVVDGACIFLNRPGFAAGPGCAFHTAALRRGDRPLDYKPAVCWQLPLRREDTVEDDGWVTSRIIEWDRRHWGDGGYDFHWWCTDAPDAFQGQEPVYRAMRDELVELMGEHIYELATTYLDERRAGKAHLRHPALDDSGGQLRR